MHASHGRAGDDGAFDQSARQLARILVRQSVHVFGRGDGIRRLQHVDRLVRFRWQLQEEVKVGTL